MTQPEALTSLYNAIKNTSPCKCHLLKDASSKEIPSTSDSVGISFIDDNISEFILKLRISDDLPKEIRKLPVVFIGYRSMRSLIKSEKYPRLMASQGIYYLRLPAGVDEIRHTLDVASKCEITDPNGAIKELMPSAGR